MTVHAFGRDWPWAKERRRGTAFHVTPQLADGYLDGNIKGSEEGTRGLFDKLAAEIGCG